MWKEIQILLDRMSFLPSVCVFFVFVYVFVFCRESVFFRLRCVSARFSCYSFLKLLSYFFFGVLRDDVVVYKHHKST